LAGIEFIRLALVVESFGSDEEALGAGSDQFAMERKAEATGFLDAKDLETFGSPALDLGDELLTGELAGRLRSGVTTLNHSHNEVQMDVQAKLENGFARINNRAGEMLTRRQIYWFGPRAGLSIER